jgi:hypothetical protein
MHLDISIYIEKESIFRGVSNENKFNIIEKKNDNHVW